MPIEAFNQFRSYVATEIRELDFTVENEIMYKDLKSSIENIQNDFVITYVDKVSANYAIICKYFYSKLLCNHILNNNSFQKSIHINREDDNRPLALNKRLNIHLNNIKYPSIFLTPKFHKSPIKFRSITNGYNTYITRSGKILQSLLQNLIDNLQNTAIIKNSLEIARVTKDMMICSMHGFEFGDLFNSIDTDDMIKVLQLIYDKYELYTSMKKEKFDILVNLVLKENFITFDQNLYKQIKGLRQGGPASNCLANLYLHFFELDHVVNDSYLIYRYIDDIIIFGKNIEYKPNITFYPDYLKLLKTNFNSNMVEFLDLDLHLINNIVVSNIFDTKEIRLSSI
ncbi:reverse transcriptase domain-containing protein [Trichonephila clavipes]|uniref:Reverse transcriptase domain-containing protein n=1 Tax=Trichonephila clavipes TaxID=2585209 RepID=A0A8X6SZI2_TRICX|nr:reverse transcriptase domain-containing protein [Trichonephila clavipes]